MMIEAAFWLAVLCGMMAAYLGNPTAWPLLASAALAYGLDVGGVTFDYFYWMLIDFAVAFFIFRPAMTVFDIAILVLFIPAWVFYIAEDPWRYWGTSFVVDAQLMLTLPCALISCRKHSPSTTRSSLHRHNEDDEFDLRARHDPAVAT